MATKKPPRERRLGWRTEDVCEDLWTLEVCEEERPAGGLKDQNLKVVLIRPPNRLSEAVVEPVL